jgi:hypothetical protein
MLYLMPASRLEQDPCPKICLRNDQTVQNLDKKSASVLRCAQQCALLIRSPRKERDLMAELMAEFRIKVGRLWLFDSPCCKRLHRNGI